MLLHNVYTLSLVSIPSRGNDRETLLASFAIVPSVVVSVPSRGNIQNDNMDVSIEIIVSVPSRGNNRQTKTMNVKQMTAYLMFQSPRGETIVKPF